MTRRHPFRFLIAAPVAAAVLLCPAVPQAAPANAADLYARALSREQAVRSNPSASADDIRAIAKAYDDIVAKFPSSGYADNALWQAGNLFGFAYTRTHEAADRLRAQHDLQWLKSQYASSSFAKQVDGALARLGAPDATTAGGVEKTAGTSLSPASSSTPVAQTTPLASTVPDPVLPPPSGPAAFVKSITESALPRGERITVELSREVAFAGDRVDRPDRVFYDFSNVVIPSSVADKAQGINGSIVKSLRVSPHKVGVARLVLELNGAPRYSAFPLYNPFRLVIDLESSAPPPVTIAAPAPVFTPPPAASAPPIVEKTAAPDKPVTSIPVSDGPAPAAPASTKSGDYSLARQLGLSVSRIVIDAGHGGHDPGAQGFGVNESELVLDVAQRLAKLLQAQPGVQVVLTRDSDEFIPLQERTAIANREGADLFVSIHANASRQATAHGVETYFLNFASNPAAEAVAARENATSTETMGTLPEILKAIALNNKLAESRELATMVQTSMVARLGAQNKSIRDLGVKQAPFVVLIGAQMPSILAEISFVTNHTDATLLKQDKYRQRIAQALCDGVLKYQASLKKVTAPAPAGR
jgi:N-acetylmuramoyl-L-alanine amidase